MEACLWQENVRVAIVETRATVILAHLTTSGHFQLVSALLLAINNRGNVVALGTRAFLVSFVMKDFNSLSK